ncbi:hypothetical protein [Bacillus sp. RAR_GA_16]|uniref:hypothetical protein n=1 Tax=Bacillus sp. RAR_GA_16 TaxID=2876774 RepID=UPI001CCA4B7F|nr:hypothetical protein [Bacillus sp. RAR_GA_16]MCA0173354.1 hypothetical protein [Bacillus sp. RAR_GA_16]
MKRNVYPLEVLLWSIAFPGFGQIINKMYIRGAFFIVLEFVINVNANLNMNILYSFQWKSAQAIEATNYEWAMFYPCVYLFAIYESYLSALEKSGQEVRAFLALPFVGGAYFSTIGVIFSTIRSMVLPPTFVAILGIVLGVGIGGLLRVWLIHYNGIKKKP